MKPGDCHYCPKGRSHALINWTATTDPCFSPCPEPVKAETQKARQVNRPAFFCFIQKTSHPGALPARMRWHHRQISRWPPNGHRRRPAGSLSPEGFQQAGEIHSSGLSLGSGGGQNDLLSPSARHPLQQLLHRQVVGAMWSWGRSRLIRTW